MVALIATLSRTSSSHGSIGKLSSPIGFNGMSSGLSPQLSQGNGSSASFRRKTTKLEVAEAFISNLRSRGDIDIQQDGFLESIKEHFEGLPSRCAFHPSIFNYFFSAASFVLPILPHL